MVICFPARAETPPAPLYSDDGFCFVMGEMMEGAKNNAAGIKMDDAFSIKSVSPDCRKKEVAFTFVTATPSELFQSSMLNKFFCPEESKNYPEINPYLQAIIAGWKLSANVTFPDGTTKEMALCQ